MLWLYKKSPYKEGLNGVITKLKGYE